jgi:ADP-ribose pyrophosphatase YjhB (NUDIX family)
MTDNEELAALTRRTLELIDDPRNGLPDEVFILASQITPLLNVDLLIKNAHDEILLTWRDDEFYGPGWHVPGGILRFKEKLADRIRKVALAELGTEVSFAAAPIALNELFAPQRNVRGHFVSLLFECRLENPPLAALKFCPEMPKNGQWQWHKTCPGNLIREHEIYRSFF